MKTVSIIGGSGFVGQAVSAVLTDQGHTVRIVRRQDSTGMPLECSRYYPNSIPSIAKAVEGSDAVINLVGILNSRRYHPEDFFVAHVLLTRNVIAACRAKNITRYLHMSALNASIASPSRYLRTKGAAENIAHHEPGIQTTSFQPSVIFGAGDSFLNRFVAILKYAPPIFPLACADTLFAPVYIRDVAVAIANSLCDEAIGQRIQLCGKERYTLKEIVTYVAGLIRRRIYVIGLRDFTSKLQAQLCEFVPGIPFSMDNYYSLQLDSVCSDTVSCPTRLSEVGHKCLS